MTILLGPINGVKPSNYKTINISRNSLEKYINLHPKKLGPFNYIEPAKYVTKNFDIIEKDNEKYIITVVNNFENFWNGTKIYSKDIIEKSLQKNFFDRRDLYFKDKNTKYIGPIHDEIAYYIHSDIWMNDEIDSYQIKKFYFFYYSLLIIDHPLFKELEIEYAKGINYYIIGDEMTDVVECNRALLEKNVNTTKYFGYEHVLAGLINQSIYEIFSLKENEE